MIDSSSFAKHSPYKATHAPSESTYKLHNTTVDLLKFQLHQQRRSVINDAEASRAISGPMFPLSNSLISPHTAHISACLENGRISISQPPPHTINLSDEPSLSIDSFIETKSSSLSPLNVLILIERAMLAAGKVPKNAILPLVLLRQLESDIAQKIDEYSRLTQEISRSQEFIHSISSGEYREFQNLGSSVFLKIISLVLQQQSRLLKIHQDLTTLTTKLNNHNLACLAMGNFVDVKVSELASTSCGLRPTLSISLVSLPTSPVSSDIMPRPLALPSPSQVTSSIDTIFSHIAQIAVQRGVSLPSPPSTGPGALIDGDLPLRTAWLIQCIDTVLDSSRNQATHSKSLASPAREPRTNFDASSSELDDMSIQEYKTALNDLRFTHQYLVKEYEHLREVSALTLQESRKRSARLERQVSQLRSPMTGGSGAGLYTLQNTSVSSLVSPSKVDFDSLKAKEQEIARLRREIDARKVETLGEAPPSPNWGVLHLQSSSTSQNLPISPHKDQEMAEPQNPSPINGFNGLPKSLNKTSAGILRKEFKKIVNDIHERYEVELGEERSRRRSLETEIGRLKLAGIM